MAIKNRLLDLCSIQDNITHYNERNILPDVRQAEQGKRSALISAITDEHNALLAACEALCKQFADAIAFDDRRCDEIHAEGWATTEDREALAVGQAVIAKARGE